MGKRLSQTSCCSSVPERRDEQKQPVFLLLAEDRGRHEKAMFRLQDRTTLIPDVRNITLTLIEREDDTRS
jgi:hypothetical protein